jgi:S-formylglutathione hydrolase FrmB
MLTRLAVNAVRVWFRRLIVLLAAVLTLPALTSVVDGDPTATAFSREGLPVEYLDVYSTAMGRNIRVQFQPGAAPAAPRRWTRVLTRSSSVPTAWNRLPSAAIGSSKRSTRRWVAATPPSNSLPRATTHGVTGARSCKP